MSARPSTPTKRAPGEPAPEGAGRSGAAEARRHLADLTARLRQLDQQDTVLRGFERRLSEQVRVAHERARPPEYVREIVQRRLSVQARIEEVEVRQGSLLAEQERLVEHVEHLGPADLR